MDSSTSHSESRAPLRALQLLGIAMAVWLAGFYYTLNLNPETVFDRHCHLVKQSWARQLEQKYPHKFVFCGGSIVRTSIDGQRMLDKHNLPVLNMGLAAGMGAKTIARYSLESLKAGDTLVVSLEPDLLGGELKQEPYGARFAISIGDFKLLDAGWMQWASALADCRPNSYHVFTLAGKVLLKKPLYRYSRSEIHASGWQEVADRREFALLEMPESLSPDGKALLASMRDTCAQRGVRVAYLAPWVYYPSDQRDFYQQRTLKFLCEVSEVIPVLEDPCLGVHTVREHFADTPLHLTAEAATLRTDDVAERLQKWKLWSRADLQAQLQLKL